MLLSKVNSFGSIVIHQLTIIVQFWQNQFLSFLFAKFFSFSGKTFFCTLIDYYFFSSFLFILIQLYKINTRYIKFSTLSQKWSKSPHKNGICHRLSRCNGICLVFEPDLLQVYKLQPWQAWFLCGDSPFCTVHTAQYIANHFFWKYFHQFST